MEERIVAYSNGSRPLPRSPASAAATHTGTFATTDTLQSVQMEAAQWMTSQNVSRLWNGSWHSVVDRTRDNGYLPTSVSGGYGGITQEFVRDASGA